MNDDGFLKIKQINQNSKNPTFDTILIIVSIFEGDFWLFSRRNDAFFRKRCVYRCAQTHYCVNYHIFEVHFIEVCYQF